MAALLAGIGLVGYARAKKGAGAIQHLVLFPAQEWAR
jgi:hypothetical protein